MRVRSGVVVLIMVVAAACASTRAAQPAVDRTTQMVATTTIASTTIALATTPASTSTQQSTSVGPTTAAATTALATAPSTTVRVTTPPTTALPPQPVVEHRVIGMSVGGRAIIAMHKPGSDHTTRRILVVGQIHGEESAGKGVVADLVSMHIPDSVDLWMITTVNPDGGAIGRRTNNNGVDLNRNFPTNWAPPGGPNTSAEHNSGSGPGSEPETQAAMSFIASIHPDVSIWYHQPYHWVDCDLGLVGSVCRGYAARVGYTINHEVLPGTAIEWEMQNGYGLAFVVEFGYGTATAASLARQASAAVSV